jgi:hypothetical protein
MVPIAGDACDLIDTCGVIAKVRDKLEELDRRCDRLMKRLRDKGARDAWSRERERLAAGRKGSRYWTDAQRKDIIEGRRPKSRDGQTIEGHHRRPVEDHPDLADDPDNIDFLHWTDHLDVYGKGHRSEPMQTLDELFRRFEPLATVLHPDAAVPASADITRASESLALNIPDDFAKFLQRFFDRQPPFWEMLRVPASSSAACGVDIVAENLFMRSRYPAVLRRCILFNNSGSGEYDCFVYSEDGRLMGVGVWRQYDDPNSLPSVLWPSFSAWLTDEISSLSE